MHKEYTRPYYGVDINISSFDGETDFSAWIDPDDEPIASDFRIALLSKILNLVRDTDWASEVEVDQRERVDLIDQAQKNLISNAPFNLEIKTSVGFDTVKLNLPYGALTSILDNAIDAKTTETNKLENNNEY